MLDSTLQLSLPDPNYPNAPSIEFPVRLESIRQGHITTAQANAVVAALFAGIQAQLLSGIPDNTDTPLVNALILFSYAGLLLSIGASLSAMGLLDFLGEIPERSRQSEPQSNIAIPTSTTSHTLEPLISYGADPKMRTSYDHCQATLIIGAFCLVVQIALLAWLKSQSVAVFVVIIVVCFLSVVTTHPGQTVLAVLSGIAESCFKK
ncbi:hypothetical protein GALMADRAFT_584421 [Galerina marginata CBS 339.88]|uniref:Uncharacterized protein n=1 Tax=Galerina marginata (strain CBS 339.88) TaxID=685588 RepID=A0A067T626_GALM3|nr:hypothetical protein GALMADRAFT_584421 [Galerina marginata CBS 339.88]